MNPFVLAGIGGATVAVALWWVLAPRLTRPTLAELLADPPPDPAEPVLSPAGIGALGVPVLAALGLPGARTRHRLRMCDRTIPDYLAQKATMAMVALGGPVVLGPVLALLGIPLTLPLLGWVLFALVLWTAPDTDLHRHARQRSEQMRHAITTTCDLVVISLAGGAGVTGALTDATHASDSWAMRRLRVELTAAAIRHDPPWTALDRLGDRYDVPAARELAASLRLAGADGARVRSSLSAKATSLRTHHLAELEADAHAATERMSLPVTLLFGGFLLLIGYPALALIMTTL
ncbi:MULTISPECIES: type II secretion protein F [unclassified Nocardiopsis]|uniref:type II secretion protein F n=1 Tax=Nocardiopsis TaxID=2013 RepID=UPI00387B2BBC